jgi:hypothetical protein
VASTIRICVVFRRVLQQRGEGDALEVVAPMRQATVTDLTPPFRTQSVALEAIDGVRRVVQR